MAYQISTLDETLAAAAGDDPVLLAELRKAFADSLTHHLDLLQRARCDGNWRIAALRIKSLAASFQAQPLIDLADAAVLAAPGEPTIIRALGAFLDGLASAGS